MTKKGDDLIFEGLKRLKGENILFRCDDIPVVVPRLYPQLATAGMPSHHARFARLGDALTFEGLKRLKGENILFRCDDIPVVV